MSSSRIHPVFGRRLMRHFSPAQRALLCALLLLLLRLAVVPETTADQLPSPETVTVQSVTDGDTVVLDDGRRVRLLGIDAPETAHHQQRAEFHGQESAAWLRSLLQGQSVQLQRQGQDHYGRELAWVRLADGTLVNELSLSLGMSKLLDRFGLPAAMEPQLRIAESRARLQRLGVWKRRH
jgi:micrococcal nuclease